MVFAESEITAFTYRIQIAPETWGKQALKFHFFLTWAGHQACLCPSENPALHSGHGRA